MHAPLELCYVVVTEEGDGREVLGIYQRTDEDAVIYNEWETGELGVAPADCVEVKPGAVNYRGPGGLVELA